MDLDPGLEEHLKIGQYIEIGLVLTIETDLTSPIQSVTSTDLSEAIAKTLDIDLNLYHMSTNADGRVVFNLSAEYLGESLIRFIRQQAELSRLFSFSDEVIEKLIALHDVETLKQYVESAASGRLYMGDFCRERLEVGGQQIHIRPRALVLASAGKILFEEDASIFTYFEKTIHMQNHPLARCIKVEIN